REGSDRGRLKVERGELELLQNPGHDPLTQVDRITGGLAVSALERERHRLLPVADRDRAAVLDLLQSSLKLLRRRRARQQEHERRRREDPTQRAHRPARSSVTASACVYVNPATSP